MRVQVVLNGVLRQNLGRKAAGGQQVARVLEIGGVELMDDADERREPGNDLWWRVLAGA